MLLYQVDGALRNAPVSAVREPGGVVAAPGIFTSYLTAGLTLNRFFTSPTTSDRSTSSGVWRA